MKIERCGIPDVLVITPERISDHRGFLAEAWNQRALSEAGVVVDFVQENIAVSPAPFTVRGLHFQSPPDAQAKLMRVSRGRARYAAVDLRRSSKTYGQTYVRDLATHDACSVFTPAGFAHGIFTLMPDTEISYHVSAHHAAHAERALKWDDPDLAIEWTGEPSRAVMSEKDRAGLAFRTFVSPFA